MPNLPKTISRKQAIHLINSIKDGSIFTVEFIKRTTGEHRIMNCRKGVTKHLAGGELAFDPKKKALIGVFDMQKRQYRFISTESILSLHADGEKYEVSDSSID
jgi:hypothetical protein